MSDGDRPIALTTACDDLQAQLEAGDRSVRHIDHDLTQLRRTLDATIAHTGTLAELQRHVAELRLNMCEQRTALREVRIAARRLCGVVADARDRFEALSGEKEVLERTHAQLVAEHTRLRTATLPSAADNGAGDPMTGGQPLTASPLREASDFDEKG